MQTCRQREALWFPGILFSYIYYSNSLKTSRAHHHGKIRRMQYVSDAARTSKVPDHAKVLNQAATV